MTKVLVIGGGIAGYCAALAARRAGAEVTVVARAPGATALYAGAMEVVDDLDAILKSEGHHPFTRLGLDSVRLAHELDTAIQLLVLGLEKAAGQIVEPRSEQINLGRFHAESRRHGVSTVAQQ